MAVNKYNLGALGDQLLLLVIVVFIDFLHYFPFSILLAYVC